MSVSAHNIVKSFGNTHVVKSLSLEVGAGEMVSLLGPSGCGKTTTLRMIAGLMRIDGGTLHIGKKLVDDGKTFVAPEKRALGMVFQSYAIWPHKSVRENVAYPLERKGTPKSEIPAKVKQALDWVRLAQLADRKPHELSGGQLQRVALARALVHEPSVLLLDEPLSNLDATLREELRAEIAALRARVQTTMIYVTHDQSEALALSDRIAVMNKGIIEQLDVPQRVYDSPATPFVAGFVGGANVIQGHAADGKFVVGDQTLTLPPGLEAAAGPHTLVVRAEDIAVDGADRLPLVARLYLGHSTEYRFQLGPNLLRAVGPHSDAPDSITIRRGLLFPTNAHNH
jgi:ABC-type Fe3+/spermidine/putrescine transport system ATPase subunit